MNFSKLLGSYKKKPKKRIPPEDISGDGTGNKRARREKAPERTVTVYFVHVPKTAGSAIKQIFAKEVKEKFTEGWRLKATDGTTVHIIAQGHSRCNNFPKGSFKFATVREPIDRFLRFGQGLVTEVLILSAQCL